MLKKLFIPLMLLVACGTSPYLWEPLEPTTNCLGPYFVYQDAGTLNADVLAKNELILKRLFTRPWSYTYDGGYYESGPLFANDRDFCDAFAGVHITYEWKNEFQCGNVPPYNECWGLTTLDSGIFLEYSGRSLAHELIHVYEGQHLIFNSGDHPDWGIKGYYYLNDTLYDSMIFPDAMTGPDGGMAP